MSVLLSVPEGLLPVPVAAELPGVMQPFSINTPLRLAHFLAQCAHESADFRVVRENLNYSPTRLRQVFPKYFTASQAARYGGNPEAIANRVYADRMGNGGEESGDGWRYRGRGYIQFTGKVNYSLLDQALGEDILRQPDLVASRYPLWSAGWFWNYRKLNLLADKGPTPDVLREITRKVNGGTNGLSDRMKKFEWYYSRLS